MPPFDPKLRPALEAALSRDTKRPGDHGWHRDASEAGWEMIFGDGCTTDYSTPVVVAGDVVMSVWPALVVIVGAGLPFDCG